MSVVAILTRTIYVCMLVKKGKKDKKGNTSKKDKHFSVIFMCSEYTALEAVV